MLLHYESCENVLFGYNRNMGHRAWTSAAQFIKRSSRIDKAIENVTKNGLIDWKTDKYQRSHSKGKKKPWPAIVILIGWILSLACIAG